MKKTSVSFASQVAAIICLCITGCNNSPPPTTTTNPAPQKTTPASEHKDDHPHQGHGAGPHDGALADWGGGKFHVEFTVDHDKQEATVFILGDDEKTAMPVKAEMLLLSISQPKFQIELTPAPLDGEADGLSSRFVGKHKKLGIVQEFEGTISGEVDGTPYAGDFKEEPHGEHEHK